MTSIWCLLGAIDRDCSKIQVNIFALKVLQYNHRKLFRAPGSYAWAEPTISDEHLPDFRETCLDKLHDTCVDGQDAGGDAGLDAGEDVVEAAHQCWSSTSEWCARALWVLYALLPVGCTTEGSHPARNKCHRRRNIWPFRQSYAVKANTNCWAYQGSCRL